jgi:hypothetical protein
VAKLDAECRLSAYDPHVAPSSLLLLQASLAEPPVSWKKHALPCLARQVRKLVSEANARSQERQQLARLAQWGKSDAASEGASARQQAPFRQQASGDVLQGSTATTKPAAPKYYTSARDVATTTGQLSAGEAEIVDNFEAVQRWQQARLATEGASTRADGAGGANEGGDAPTRGTALVDSLDAAANEQRMRRAVVGVTPSAHDGRVAFLLAFAKVVELEVTPTGGAAEVLHSSQGSHSARIFTASWRGSVPTDHSAACACACVCGCRGLQVVNALFCGTSDEPLLVQRIGKARDQAVAAAGAPENGASGAKAVPSLGYVARSTAVSLEGVDNAERQRRAKDNLLVEAAEKAMAKHWAGGRTVALPLPPPGFQWELGATEGHEEAAEGAVKLTAALSKEGHWSFTIGGVKVEAYDARSVISPCSLDTSNHTPHEVDEGLEVAEHLRTALYVPNSHGVLIGGQALLDALCKLHAHAADTRRRGAQEGHVYNWVRATAQT